MSYLHLPEQHSDADVVLAGQVAAAFESGHLYVTWTHAPGADTAPTVQAVVRELPPHPLVEAFGILFGALADALRSLRRRPAAAPHGGEAPQERQTA
jgi:hypothetical protein